MNAMDKCYIFSKNYNLQKSEFCQIWEGVESTFLLGEIILTNEGLSPLEWTGVQNIKKKIFSQAYRTKFYKTFYGRNLQMFIISWSVCPLRPSQGNVMFVGKASILILEWSTSMGLHSGRLQPDSQTLG